MRLKPKYLLCCASVALWVALPKVALGAASKSVLVDPASREQLVRRAEVWFSPNWISANGEFAKDFDPAQGPTEGPVEPHLRADTVACSYIFDEPLHGENPKFKCDLTVSNLEKKPLRLKVKYGATNGEVWGEVLASRLLWSLGFGADREFFVQRLLCDGCGTDPFHQTASVAASTQFTPAAIERKFVGTELIKVTDLGNGKTRQSAGWGFEELNLLSIDAAVASRQSRDRNALTLLAIFLNHLDNRKSNQRLVCIDGSQGNECTGATAMILQDVGSTFGGGYDPTLKDLLKVDFDAWKAKAIWSDSATCTGSVSPWGSQNMKTARISEDGRLFLLHLLKGFAADRSRVESLFGLASIEMRGGHSVKEWTDVFLGKIKEIESPGGQAGFVCPPLAAPVSSEGAAITF